MSQTQENPCRVITPICRLSYPHIFKPAKPVKAGDQEKYQCELIFDSEADLSALKKAAQLAAREKWGDKIPANLRSPFRKGDTDREGKDGYEGSIFIGARSTDRPGVIIGRDRKVCTDESEVYGGCYVKASITAFAYENTGNKGVSFALNNIWKIRDGEPFGSRQNAEDEFSDVEVDADAFGDYSDAESSLL